MDDRELLDLIPLLEKLSKVDSVYAVLKNKEQVQQHLQQIQSNSGNNQSSLKRSQTSGSSSAATAAVTWWPWAWPLWAWPPRLPSGPLLQPPSLPRCLPSHCTLFDNLICSYKFYQKIITLYFFTFKHSDKISSHSLRFLPQKKVKKLFKTFVKTLGVIFSRIFLSCFK